MPVVGWLILRGRARCCGLGISPLDPTVEASTASVWALLAAVTGPVWLLAVALPVSAGAMCPGSDPRPPPSAPTTAPASSG